MYVLKSPFCCIIQNLIRNRYFSKMIKAIYHHHLNLAQRSRLGLMCSTQETSQGNKNLSFSHCCTTMIYACASECVLMSTRRKGKRYTSLKSSPTSQPKPNYLGSSMSSLLFHSIMFKAMITSTYKRSKTGV